MNTAVRDLNLLEWQGRVLGPKFDPQAARTENYTPFLSFLRISNEDKIPIHVRPLPALERADVESTSIISPWSAVLICFPLNDCWLLGLACVPITFFFLQTAQKEFIRSLVASAAIDRPPHMEEFRGYGDKPLWPWLGLAMHLEELSSFVDIENCDGGHSSAPQFLTGVSFDAELLENIAEKFIDLFFSDLIREVFYNDLHDDRRRSEGI